MMFRGKTEITGSPTKGGFRDFVGIKFKRIKLSGKLLIFRQRNIQVIHDPFGKERRNFSSVFAAQKGIQAKMDK